VCYLAAFLIIVIIIFVTLLVAYVARLLFSVLSVLFFCLYCCYIIYCMLPLEVNKVVHYQFTRISRKIRIETNGTKYIHLYSPKWQRKNNNAKTIKSKRKIEANNLTKQIKICKHLPIQFMIYSSINQLISNNN